MKTSVQQWGLALGIPKALAGQVNVRKGGPVHLTMEKGKPVMTPLPGKELSLKQLLAKIKAENVHPEMDWGPKVGRET
jgi:antitoxin MazE